MLKSAGNFLCLLEMALMGNFSFSCNRKLKCFANRSTAVCCGTINSKESQNIKKEVKKTAASSSSIATLILANSK